MNQLICAKSYHTLCLHLFIIVIYSSLHISHFQWTIKNMSIKFMAVLLSLHKNGFFCNLWVSESEKKWKKLKFDTLSAKVSLSIDECGFHKFYVLMIMMIHFVSFSRLLISQNQSVLIFLCLLLLLIWKF